MKKRYSILICIWGLIFYTSLAVANTFEVASQQEFNIALNNAQTNDTISWQSGIYADISMEIHKNDIFITTQEMGAVVFTGRSRVNISGDHITLNGFQFLDGNIGTQHLIETRGSYNIFTNINIKDYTCYKYLIIHEESQFCEITYCNFENRINLDDQNILSILVDDRQPGFHKIRFCSFKNFDGNGGDMGIEPIRIGVSTQSQYNSRSLVEFCYFKQCNGDGEIISSKASQNVYRFNTFEDNPHSALVLRHGSEIIVYGNFFLDGMGGVRIREGQNHFIYNNYFSNLNRWTIMLQNEEADPVENIQIAFNTLVNTAENRLGSSGPDDPEDVTFANNIFANTNSDDLFDDATRQENWIGNIFSGDLGISTPPSGLEEMEPRLQRNNDGFWSLSENSPAIDAAESGFSLIPQFDGMDPIDTNISYDLMMQRRPSSINEKDLGCNEFPQNIEIRPFAREDNTGPIYLRPETSSIDESDVIVSDLIAISPNPVQSQIRVEILKPEPQSLIIEIYNLEGKKIKEAQTAETPIHLINVSDYPTGRYIIKATTNARNGVSKRVQSLQFIKIK